MLRKANMTWRDHGPMVMHLEEQQMPRVLSATSAESLRTCKICSPMFNHVSQGFYYGFGE